MAQANVPKPDCNEKPTMEPACLPQAGGMSICNEKRDCWPPQVMNIVFQKPLNHRGFAFFNNLVIKIFIHW